MKREPLRAPPALRDRASDIRVLAHLLVKNLAPDAQLTEAAVAALGRYHWPGNVRELRNVLTRAYVLGGPEIGPENLSFNPWTFDDTRSPDTLSKVDLAQQEKEAIVLALQESNGNKSQAARSLGLPRSSLIYKMERLQIG
jgi:DNA-binding NtrC family response regulator